MIDTDYIIEKILDVCKVIVAIELAAGFGVVLVALIVTLLER